MAVFGFLTMGNNHNHNGCIAALARLQGIFCPGGNESFSFVNFHLDFFKSFSNVFILDNIVGLLTVVFAAFLITFSVVFFSQPNFLALAPIKQSSFNKFSSNRSFIRYLSFLENSPNFV